MRSLAHCGLVFLSLTVAYAAPDFSSITCGSAIKILNKPSGYRVHSHDIKWGSGSGQQSVTANSNADDTNSLWFIRPTQGNVCWQGTVVKFGDKIRLQHHNTRRNLHSHSFQSPISGQQEVSCFGDNGDGDSGDDWEVVPTDASKFGQSWGRDDSFRLRHVVTRAYLSTNKRHNFNQQNCGQQCPIAGQLEVACSGHSNADTEWYVGEGVFFPVEESEK